MESSQFPQNPGIIPTGTAGTSSQTSSPNFCGVVFPNRPVITSFQMLAPDKYIIPIENVSITSHVCVFLTGCPPLQSTLGCAIYLSLHPFTSWTYLGSVSNLKPSTILRFRWPSDAIDRNVTAQLGINIVPLKNIEELDTEKLSEKKEVLSKSGDTALNVIGEKIVKNLYNYIGSMAKPLPLGDGQNSIEVVPMEAVTKWMQTFNERCRKNPKFWEDLV